MRNFKMPGSFFSNCSVFSEIPPGWKEQELQCLGSQWLDKASDFESELAYSKHHKGKTKEAEAPVKYRDQCS